MVCEGVNWGEVRVRDWGEGLEEREWEGLGKSTAGAGLNITT